MKRTILFDLIASGFAAAYLLALVPGGFTTFQRAVSEGTAMTGKIESGTVSRSAAIPPIDASPPGVTETATFALG